jgi:hypothetical protein
MNTAQKRERERLDQGSAEDSIKVGTEILSALGEQHRKYLSPLEPLRPSLLSEQQLSAANNIETTEHALEKSLRVLRGMSWSGMFYNLATPEQKPSTSIASRHQRDIYASHPDMLKYKTDRAELFDSNEATKSSISGVGKGGISKTLDQQDADLLQLSGALHHLENIGLEINKSLQTQNELTTELEEKTDQVNDIALATILRSAQLTQRAKNSHEMTLGDYTLFDMKTSQYLSVHGTALVLSSRFDRSSLFRVSVKESHILGIQSHLTLRYLGINLFGKVCVTSSHFGSYEETFLDLDSSKGSTGILFLASNWGGGGWLQYGDAVIAEDETLGGGMICSNVSKSITDVTKKVQLRAILVPPESVGDDHIATPSSGPSSSSSSGWGLYFKG